MGLLVPLALYNLTLKLVRVTALGSTSPSATLELVSSDLLFNFGFVLFWVGLAIVAWEWRGMRTIVIGFAQLSALLYGVVTTAAHRYYETTGSVLDFGLLRFAATHVEDLGPAMASETPWILYAALGLHVAFTPRLLMGLARRLPRDGATAIGLAARRGCAAIAAGLALCISAFFAPPTPGSVAFARDPLVQIGATAMRLASDSSKGPGGRPAISAHLSRVAKSPLKNVALIILESTGAHVTTLHSPELPTTPFLAELAQRSAWVERAYTTIPHTSKALISILCGIEPRPSRPLTESLPGLIPATCLPELLSEQGYDTVFFQSATEHFEARRQLVDNFGYEEFYSKETLPSDGFEPANYFGPEDVVMLEPGRVWLAEHRDRPFFATYLTNTPHHDYRAPDRYGLVSFVDDDEHDRYLNAVRYLDFFVRELIAQYRDLGLYEETLFVVVGDHGEAFGEHDRLTHDDVLYEEVIRVPLIVHDPQGKNVIGRLPGPASVMDILPTVIELLGFDLGDAEFAGKSLLTPSPRRRLGFSCYNDARCLGQLDGSQKYIHYYGDRPDEVYDLADDPGERKNLAPELGARVETLRAGVLDWAASLEATYRRHHRRELARYVSTTPPDPAHERQASFGGRLTLVGYDLSAPTVSAGNTVKVSYHFYVEDRIPPSWRLVTEAEGDPVSGGEDAELADVGHRPLEGLYRLKYWRPGEFVTDVQEIHIPPDWRSDVFTIYMSVLDKRGETRVALDGDDPFEKTRFLVVTIPVMHGTSGAASPNVSTRSHGREERRSR